VTSCSATRSGAASTTATSAKAFRQAVKRAGLQAPGKLTLHSLRHGFASLLIANGLNVVYVSRQLGHANPSITLEVYAHLFDRADHAATARDALDLSYRDALPSRETHSKPAIQE
jgi:integrase